MGYDALIDRPPMPCLVDVRGAPGSACALFARTGLTVPTEPNTWARTGERIVAFVGPRRWMLVAPLAHEPALLEGLPRQVAGGTAVPVSDAFAAFSVSGPQASEIVAQASPLDVHPLAFPVNGASFTVLFGQAALLLRRDSGFDCFVDASVEDYVADRFTRCHARTGPWFAGFRAGRA